MLTAMGCAREEAKEPDAGQYGAIRFRVTTSRAAVATVSDLYGGFRVFAAPGDVASTGAWSPGIDGTNNHLHTNGVWGFETPVSWSADEAEYPITFYAWYPANETAGPSLTENDPSATPVPLLRGTFTVAPAAAQVDFLTSRALAAEKPPQGNLSMTFNHALSKIDIGIASGKGTTPVIQALGVACVGGTRTYDFIAGDWTSAQPAGPAEWYPYFGTLDFRTGGAASTAPLWTPGAAATEGRISRPYDETANAHLMLMPQTGTPWKPRAGVAPDTDAALIYVLYRMTAGQPAGYPADEVGYGRASDHPGYMPGDYAGPLYVLAGFPLSTAAAFTWSPGKGYTYDISLGTLRSGNGYLLSDYYYDEKGAQTAIPVRGGRRTGEKIKDGVIRVTLTVGGWEDQPVDPSTNP
jgi:hypothetical protein